MLTALIALSACRGGAHQSALNVRVLSQATNDLVLDPVTGHLWASVARDAALHRNTVIEVDPLSGSILRQIDVGKNSIAEPNDPAAMAISDDGSALYVGLNGVPGIRQIDPKSGATVSDYTFFGQWRADEIKVRPGHPDTIAVTWYVPSISGGWGPMIVRNGKALEKRLGDYKGPSIAFGSPNRLFAADGYTSSFALTQCAVYDNGVSEVGSFPSTFPMFRTHIDKYGDRIYSSDGTICDAVSGQKIVRLKAKYGDGCVADIPNNRIFVLEEDISDSNNTYIEAFDLTTYASVARKILPTVSLEAWNIQHLMPNLVRFGPKGLAFRTAGAIVFIDNAPGL